MEDSTQEPVRRQRLAVVTGASSGIGAATVDHLLAQGWSVVAVSRRPPVRRPGVRPVSADVTDAGALAHALAQELAAAEQVDAVVHAAGAMTTAPLGRLDPTAGALMWDLHVQAPQHLVQHLLDRVPDGGRIVLVGSRTAGGAAGRSQYAASKAALSGLARSWAAELIGRGVTVNVVAPGATDTPFLAAPGRESTPAKVPPLGRLVRPEEVAGTIGFLLGPHAGAITGQQLVVCGGASL